jgi:hypothetical protein
MKIAPERVLAAYFIIKAAVFPLERQKAARQCN